MIAPWVTAARILEQKAESGIDFFYNFVLGKAYQPSEFLINREAIMNANFPGLADKKQVMIGCDSGKTKHYVMGNKDGVFNYGRTDEWGDIERMIQHYDATCVIDALPDFTVPEHLARKYPGKVYVNYYVHDTKNFDIVRKKEGVEFGVIQSDRTKLFDQLAQDISVKKLKFFQEPKHLNELIYHLENMYRLVEPDTKGIDKAKWETKENKPDHWAHALAYFKIAQMISTSAENSGVINSPQPVKKQRAFGVHDGKVKVEHALGMKLDTLIEQSIRKTGKRRV